LNRETYETDGDEGLWNVMLLRGSVIAFMAAFEQHFASHLMQLYRFLPE
jgi:hypothetical protein